MQNVYPHIEKEIPEDIGWYQFGNDRRRFLQDIGAFIGV
jgi:hypothetical protein